MRIFKATIWYTWIVISLMVLFVNVRLYMPSPLPSSRNEIPATILDQLKSSRRALEGDAPKEMQMHFPEGFYFCYALYGLTWVEVALRDPQYAEQAVKEAKWSFESLGSDDGKSAFPNDLPPTNGMFYSSWRCHLQAGIVAIQNGADPEETARLRQECDSVASALREAETPFLMSYRNQTWPCDSLPAIHAMVTHDRILGQQRYREVVDRWLTQAKKRVDTETGLLPHMAHSSSGQPVQGTRATSQVLILRFLADVDPKLAREHYRMFREKFYSPLVGLPSLGEYPDGKDGVGDVDSGPLLLGRSLSATVFMMGTAQVFEDQSRADAIGQCGEAVGMPWTWKEEKRYVGGLLPIGDIMVGYNQVARRWSDENDHCPENELAMPWWWRLPTHAASSLMLLPFLFRWRRKNAGRKKEQAQKEN